MTAASLEHRWYADLVAPVRPSVEAVLRRVGSSGDGDPFAVPRAGLGSALVVHIAKGFGTRRWQRGSRAGALAVEAYNQRVYGGSPARATRSALLERDIRRGQRLWKGLLQRDEALVSRVLDRVLHGTTPIGDEPVPEAVLFLRAAVAAGVLAGDVPDEIHEVLDRYATCLGLAWEAQHQSVDQAAWGGALRSVCLEPAYPPEVADALRQARASVADLPDGVQTELFEAVLDSLSAEVPMKRIPERWAPLLAPDPETRATAPLSEGPFAEFHRRWAAEVEATLSEVAVTPSKVLSRAVAFLQVQGGKRVRPLLCLATAEACGGHASAALRPAALIEWLHQASLVVDDVVDEAELRRGTVPLHRATSIPFAMGISAFLLSRIHSVLRSCPVATRERLVTAGTALVDGQRSELQHTGDLDLSISGYYRIIDAKTASLFAAAGAIGALAVAAPSRRIRAAHRFGRELGLAFQIVDDLLDYTGTETTLGKRPGTDLRAGKVTLPVLMLRDALGVEERAELADWLQPTARADEEWSRALAQIRSWIAEFDVAERCLERAETHLLRAEDAADLLPDRTRSVLLDLGRRLVYRDR
ncbi:MAG: polyprenyl synthetase family protein [Myxococcota bacterium]